jgi:hypothetical protein
LCFEHESPSDYSESHQQETKKESRKQLSITSELLLRSESNPRADLEYSTCELDIRVFTKRATRHTGVRQVDTGLKATAPDTDAWIRVIEDIESFSSKLHPYTLSDLDVLEQTQVEVIEYGPSL